MRRRDLYRLGVGLAGVSAGVLALGACSGGTEGGSDSLKRPTTTSTTVRATTTTTTAPTRVVSDTVVRRPTTTTTPAVTEPRPLDRPVDYANGLPQVTASPARGSAGARVHVEGYGFTDAQWRPAGGAMWLAGSQPGCALYAEVDHSVTVSADGFLSGDFVVPEDGGCRQSSAGVAAVVAGDYRIAFQCTACFIGGFEVTTPQPPGPTSCQNVTFSPNSENMANDIRAAGMSCAEAEALVRKVGGPLGPVNGPATADADGFHCVRTGERASALPVASYECTSGARSVTFNRT